MAQPLVSVVLTTRNRAHLLDKSIRSVFSQTLADFEFIIIDDASSDLTAEVIDGWRSKDNRIKTFRNPVNFGIAKSMNRGLKLAQGKYLAVIDDDDPWATREKLARQVDFLEKNPDHAAVGGGMIVVNRDGKELFRYLQPRKDQDIRHTILFSNPMANATTMFRKSTAEKVGFYNEAIHSGADRDFWLKIGKVGKMYNLPEYLAYYTVAGQNSLFRDQRELFASSLSIIKRYKNDYPRYIPALMFNYFMYGYSLLPEPLRQALNMPLFYIKRKTFGRT